MGNQVYYIQKLLEDKLDNCEGKGKNYAEEHIKEIQNTYKQENIVIKKQDVKGKQ